MGYKRTRNNQSKSWRIFKNEDIKAFTILVVDENGEQLGTMQRAKALELASSKGLDLVQINYDPSTKICTAKIVDFGKFQYESKKQNSEKRKKQKAKVQKEVKFGYNIGDHDLELKVKKAIQFLGKGHPVKINVVLRGREKAYKDIVRAKLDGVEEQLKEHGKSQGIKSENHGFSLLVMSTAKRNQQQPKKKFVKKKEYTGDKTGNSKKKEAIADSKKVKDSKEKMATNAESNKPTTITDSKDKVDTDKE